MSKPENPFETGSRKVIPAVLVYIQKENHFLMIHRNSKRSDPDKGDYHQGKWNGLGGKCEADESPLEAAIREVKEESGLDLSAAQYRALGVIQFPNFKAHKSEDWIVFVFTVKLPEPDAQSHFRTNPEGDLHWIPKKDLESLNLWPGDHYFISYVIENTPFMGTLWYQEGKVVKHWFQNWKI